MNPNAEQGIHELLLGMGQEMKLVTSSLGTISQQLLDQTRAAGGPSLGFCGNHVAEWMDAGADPNTPMVPAQVVMVLPGVGPVPLCLQHFRAFKEAMGGSQLLLAQPGMPQPPGGNGLIVPGR